MQGAYHDGLTARTHTVEVTAEGGVLSGHGPTADFRWPLNGVRILEAVGGKVRLASADGDDRLILAAGDWESATGVSLATTRRENGRREGRLVGGLAAVGLLLTLGVFVGIPAAARPLAKITPLEWEETMGRNMSSQLQVAFRPCTGDEAGGADLNRLAADLAGETDMPFKVRVIAVHAPMVNAFALPGGTILVTDDLIAEARSPDEVAGVLAHEIAHIEKRHVMESVWRSLGLGLILDAVLGGGTGAGQQAVLLASGFTEQRFSRELETEADQRAFELLAAHRISTAGVADFFDRMVDRKAPEGVKAAAEWISTHPDSGRRAQRARAGAKAGAPAMSAQEWAAVRRICANSTNRLKAPFPLPR